MKRAKTLGIIILCLLMVCLLTVAFVACNDKGQQNNNVDISQDTPPDIEDNNTDPNGQGTTPGGSVDTHPSTTHTHTYTLVEENAPTCTEDGNILYYTCTCGKFFNADKQEITQAETIRHSTGHDKVTTNWESDGTSHWHKCNNCNEKLDIETHTESGWIEDASATCKAKAHHHKECTVCHYHTEEEDFGELASHTWNSQTGKCDICEIDMPYIERDGKIYFGEYPQTKVTDNGITATLAQKSGSKPSQGNRGNWKDYGYYIKDKKSEYMWYIDLEYDEERYRGVYFTAYRPIDTTKTSEYQQQSYNKYEINTLYWFKWEPIEWRVLKKETDEAFLMSNVILDSQHYYRTSGTRIKDSQYVYPSNYKESDIRAWLNDTFYKAAFNELEQEIIKETLVDNSASSTGDTSSTQYLCENTNDKVFLLSMQDVQNADYFSSDNDKILNTTGYAQSQGVDIDNTSSSIVGSWWLRSPHPQNGAYVRGVSRIANHIFDYQVFSTSTGVVPALRITL